MCKCIVLLVSVYMQLKGKNIPKTHIDKNLTMLIGIQKMGDLCEVVLLYLLKTLFKMLKTFDIGNTFSR